MKTRLILFFILLLALAFRFYGLNWDSGHHLHPDERFLTMVATSIKIPPSFSNYFDPQQSTLSPYNNNHSFFVYGTLPLNLVKIIGQVTGYTNYANIHLVGRLLSALFDTGIIFLLFIIVKKISTTRTALLSAFFYAIMVLPIQLSHFFAVDTFLNFFLLLSFYYLLQLSSSKTPVRAVISLSFSFAAALACKISALYFTPIIAIVFFAFLVKQKPRRNSNPPPERVYFHRFILLFIFPLLTLLIFRLLQPHIFSQPNWLSWRLHPQFINNLKEFQNFSNSESWFPPAVQWKNTTPVLFPLKNIIIWGLGLPLGLLFIIAFIKNLLILRGQKLPFFLLHVWILILLIYQGSQTSKTMRYFLPLYPFMAMVIALFISKLKLFQNLIFRVVFYFLLLIYPVSFISIYSHPITRLTASRWIYQNIPAGSVLATEHWDDYLPLNLPNHPASNYANQTLALYDPDTPGKWQKINQQLELSDYIILSSNRLYGSIPRNPRHYPRASQYYQDLFNGSLGFNQIAQFTSYPCFPPFGKPLFCFPDDSAEEAFTVYDHPKVLIFKKI